MLYALHAEDKQTERPAPPLTDSARHLAAADEKLRKVREQLHQPRHRVTDPQ